MTCHWEAAVTPLRHASTEDVFGKQSNEVAGELDGVCERRIKDFGPSPKENGGALETRKTGGGIRKSSSLPDTSNLRCM